MKNKLTFLSVLLLLASCVVDESASGSSTFRAGEICDQSQTQYLTDVYWTIAGKEVGGDAAKYAVKGVESFISSSPCHRLGAVYQLPSSVGIDDSQELFNIIENNKNIPDRIFGISFDRLELIKKDKYPKYIFQVIDLSFDSLLLDLTVFKKITENKTKYKGEGYLISSKAFAGATQKALDFTLRNSAQQSGG